MGSRITAASKVKVIQSIVSLSFSLVGNQILLIILNTIENLIFNFKLTQRSSHLYFDLKYVLCLKYSPPANNSQS